MCLIYLYVGIHPVLPTVLHIVSEHMIFLWIIDEYVKIENNRISDCKRHYPMLESVPQNFC